MVCIKAFGFSLNLLIKTRICHIERSRDMTTSIRKMKIYWVYILKCSDGKYYTGSTSNLEQRIAQHKSGTIKGFTSFRLPVELVFSQAFQDVNEALRAERQIKKWSHAKKNALIAGDWRLLKQLAVCANETHHRKFKGIE